MKKQVWGANIYYVCPKHSETKGTYSLKSWRLDRIINALIREFEEQIPILENTTGELSNRVSSSSSLQDELFMLRSEKAHLLLKQDLIFDNYMERDKCDGENLRNELDFINERITNIESVINEDFSALRFRKNEYIKNITRSNDMALTEEAKKRMNNNR